MVQAEREKRQKEEKAFFDGLKADLWRERKAAGKRRTTFKDAFDKFPIEDSSDEEVSASNFRLCLFVGWLFFFKEAAYY